MEKRVEDVKLNEDEVADEDTKRLTIFAKLLTRNT